MTHLQIDFVSPSWRFDQAKAPPDDVRRLGNQRERWRRECWLPYKNGQVSRSVRVHRFACGVAAHAGAKPLATDRLELPLDEQLFDSVLDIYVTYGFQGLRAAGEGGTLTGFDRDFLLRTITCLDDLIGRELVSIQTLATALARKENAQFSAVVDGSIKKFKWNDGYGSHELNLNKDVLYSRLREFRKLQLRLAGQKTRVDERLRKDGGVAATVERRRTRDEYRRLLAEQAEAPMRATLAELERLKKDIAEAFVPGLLILDELEDDLDEWMPMGEAARSKSDSRRKRSREVELTYDRKILRVLKEMKAALECTYGSLSNPGAETRLLQLQDVEAPKRLARSGSHGVVLDFALEKRPGVACYVYEGVTRGLFGLYFTWQQYEDYALANRVLGSPCVLRRLLEVVEADLPESLRRAVLKHHCLELEARLERERLDDKFLDSLWHALEVVAAAAGLLLAVLSIPFGAGAVGVPAALSAFLVVLGVSSAVLGVVVMVGSVLALVDQQMDADSELSRELVRLGFWDPDALADLGRLLSNHQAVTQALTTGMLAELVKLAAAHRLRAVAFALDMQGFLDDMNTLTGAAEEVSPQAGMATP